MPSIRIALAQINPTVGDFVENTRRILGVMSQCEESNVDFAVFPELVVNGYPPEDLVMRNDFVAESVESLANIASYSEQTASVIGYVDRSNDKVFNAAAVIHNGEIRSTYHKRILPNYAVFDEQRTFAPGQTPHRLFEIAGVRVGIVVCEDAWFADGPVSELAHGGAEVIAVLNASPYYLMRWRERLTAMQARARESGCVIVYVNCVGAQDELVFDGGSFVMGTDGEVIAALPQFSEHIAVVDLTVDPSGRLHSISLPTIELSPLTRATDRRWPAITSWLEHDEEVYEALVTGTHDYVRKNGFRDVVIGLSGGIDSSLVACIAVDALGSEHVHGLMMPSPFNSPESLEDAAILAKKLGISSDVIPIDTVFDTYRDALAQQFEGTTFNIAEENLQTRIRGNILMAMSNKFGWMVLTTGNKSELATGYCTLYGDTAGGFAVLKDVLKTRVYSLARIRNVRGDQPIPDRVFTKPPSAELRPDQRDDQSLPKYEVLDQIIEGYVEHDDDIDALVRKGLSRNEVTRVIEMVHDAEYKRRQLPPGVRITARAFGKDRRWPITNHFKPAH
jgi:NAD+ synthase (glutamine-hydrolysing)